MSEPHAGERTLGLTVDLDLSVDGATASARTAGERLVVEVPTVRDAYRIVRALRKGSPGLAGLLGHTDLTTEVRIRDRRVAVVGPAASPGRTSRLLGVGDVELRPRGLLGAGLDPLR